MLQKENMTKAEQQHHLCINLACSRLLTDLVINIDGRVVQTYASLRKSSVITVS